MPSTDCFHGQLNDPGFRLKEGDIILEIDGQPLTRATGVSDMVRGMEGTYVELKVKPQHENSRHLEPYKTKIMRRPNPILHALRFLSLLNVPDVEFLDGGDFHAANCVQVQLMERWMYLNGVCAAPGRSCASRSSFMTSLWLRQRRATATLPSDTCTAKASKKNDVGSICNRDSDRLFTQHHGSEFLFFVRQRPHYPPSTDPSGYLSI